MRSVLFLAAITSSLVEFTLGQEARATTKTRDHPKSTEVCYTHSGKKSVAHVPTKTTTSTVTYAVTRTKTVHPTKTRKPKTRTITRTNTNTATTTTELQNTDTAYVDVTTTTTTTETADLVTITQTSGTTTTSTQFVVATIGLDPGFIPIQSALPGVHIKKRDVPRHALTGSLQPAERALSDGIEAREDIERRAAQYPQRVNCRVIDYEPSTTLVTKTGKVHKTRVPAQTSTRTVNTATTITQTINDPDATTTITHTSTDTSTVTQHPAVTVVVTTTSTSTTSVPTSTSFPQCGSNNLASLGPDGGPLAAAIPNNLIQTTLVTPSANTPTDCCIACVLNPNCEFGGIDKLTNTCTLFVTNVCTSPGQYTVSVLQGLPILPATNTFFNGHCGALSSIRFF